MNITFEGQTVAVVGATSEIGAAIATSFAEAGALVWACDIAAPGDAGRGAALARENVRSLLMDVTDEKSIVAGIKTIEQASPMGSVDVLVYVSGGLLGELPGAVEDVETLSWQKVVDVNLSGCFRLCREVVPGMKRNDHGRIVVISSGAGLATSRTGVLSYCAAKHGQVGLVKQLASELAPYSINVNSVAPGFIACSADARRQWNSWPIDIQRAWLSRIIGGRLGEPQDVADATLFLSSKRARWITGQILPVSGSPI